MRVGEAATWIAGNSKGAEIIYWTGFLAQDANNATLAGRLAPLRNLLLYAEKLKLVILFQKRLADGEYAYYVRRTKNVCPISASGMVTAASAKDMTNTAFRNESASR